MSFALSESSLSPSPSQANGNVSESHTMLNSMQVQLELHDLYSDVVDRISDEPLSSNAVDVEQQAWMIVMRKYKSYLSNFITNYLMGQLNSILMMATNSQQSLSDSITKKDINPALLYNVHIHLGDLHRLKNKINQALHYYKMALRIDPSRGSVYNQLALCYSRDSTKFYERCFYLVLAVDSVNDSVNAIGGKANIAKTLARHTNPILDKLAYKYVLPDFTKTSVPLPNNGNDWFFLSVLAMHMDDVGKVLEYLMSWLETHLNDGDAKIAYDFGMMAFDSLLDYVYQDRPTSDTFSENSHQISGLDHSEIDSITGNGNSSTQNSTNIALTNNFLLRHFTPLHERYKKMDYAKERRKYNISRDRSILEAKLCYKMAFWNGPTY